MNTITLGDLPVLDRGPKGGPPTNYFRFRTGASNVGEGRFLMLRSDAATLLDASLGGPQPVQLVMTDQQGRKISIPVFVRAEFTSSSQISTANALLGPENTPQDIVEVAVCDSRSQSFTGVSFSVNQMVQEFPWDANNSVPYFYHQTLNPPNAANPIQWTWATMATALTFPVIPNAPAWNPRNLRWRSVAKPRVMDDIAARLFLIVGFDPSRNPASHDFFSPGSFHLANPALLAAATASRESGGLVTRGKFATPGVFDVSFAVDNNDASPYSAPDRVSYIKEITLQAGGSSQSVHVGGYLALYKNTGAVASTLVNQAELDAVAEDIAPRCQAFMNNQIAQYDFAGLWNFTVDGVIREVTWISDNEGARTLVQCDNNVDWVPLSDEGKTMFPLGNQLVIPLGSGGDDVSAGGTRYTWTNRNYFWARITASAPLRDDNYTLVRYKYSWNEVVRGSRTGNLGADWLTVVGGRAGDCTCTFGECNGDAKDPTHFCRWALSMYEGDNLQAAPVSPTANGLIVQMFIDYDPDGYPEYTFIHAPDEKIGTLRAAGPCGEGDYTDERYWVQVDDVTVGAIDAQLVGVAADKVPNACSGGGCPAPTDHIITATNIAELNGHTHKLNTSGSPTVNVLLTGVYDKDGTLHYVFDRPPGFKVNQFCYQDAAHDPTCSGAAKPTYTTNIGLVDEIDFNQNWFFVNQPKLMGVVCDKRALVDFTGISAIQGEYGAGAAFTTFDHTCNNTMIQLGTDANLEADEPDAFTRKNPAENDNQYPVYLKLSQGQSIDPCACGGDIYPNYNIMGIDGNVYINPADFGITLYYDSSLVGTYHEINVDTVYRLSFSGTGPAQLRWLGLEAYLCNGSQVFNGGTVPSTDGWTGLQGYNGIVFDPAIDPLHLDRLGVGLVFTGTVGVTVAGGSGSGTLTWDVTSPCSPVLALDLTITPGYGFSAIDCTAGPLAGTFATLQSQAGVVLSNVSGNLAIGLNIISGTYVSVTAAGCGYVIDVPVNTFDNFGSAAAAQAAAIAAAATYTDAQIATFGGTLPGLYDPLGSAATALANAKTYTDNSIQTAIPGIAANTPAAFSGAAGGPLIAWSAASPPLAAFAPGAGGNWAGAPATLQAAIDRIAAAVAGIIGGGIP